jgi:hypothetical protein
MVAPKAVGAFGGATLALTLLGSACGVEPLTVSVTGAGGNGAGASSGFGASAEGGNGGASSSSGPMPLCDPSVAKNCCDCTQGACLAEHEACHSLRGCIGLLSCNAACSNQVPRDAVTVFLCLVACGKKFASAKAEELLLRDCITSSCGDASCPTSLGSDACGICAAKACETSLEACWKDEASPGCVDATFCELLASTPEGLESCLKNLELGEASTQFFTTYNSCKAANCPADCTL